MSMGSFHKIVPVGLIGLGQLGLAVAERLLAAGRLIAGYRRGGLDLFAALGGLPVASVGALAETADPAVLLLPSDAALVKAVAQVTPAMRPGRVVIQVGTHRLDAKRAAWAAAKGDGGRDIAAIYDSLRRAPDPAAGHGREGGA